MLTQREKAIWNATKNRRELIAAGLSRRELFKLGLLTSAGYLVVKSGLSARADGMPTSRQTRAFIEPLPTHLNGGMVIQLPVTTLVPTPMELPNPAINPLTGLPFEGRTRAHQVWTQFPPQVVYQTVHRETTTVGHPDGVLVSPDFPRQILWGFDGISPGPTYVAHYGEPILVRNFNELPPKKQNGGFGLPSVSTHLHNGHTPSESDGFPCDFFERGQFYDQHYPNVLAGFSDPRFREAMSTLWYHDHRLGFTAQNVYKGLAGFYLLFNEFDTGNENTNTGFHLPSFPEFDIPLMFADKVFDEEGKLFFDMFNFDGILGDKFLVNGKIQPFLEVHPRRYRFRCLNVGPSRFYQFFLTDLNDLNKSIPFWQISNDGNLLPGPVQVTSTRLSVAQRADVIIDFKPFAGKSIYLENRLEQTNGRGPTGEILPAGQGNLVLRFDVVLPDVGDGSVDFEKNRNVTFYDLPDTTEKPRLVRTFRFDRSNGMWAINGKLMDSEMECLDPNQQPRFHVERGTAEHWILQNSSGGWSHPIHIHCEEFQILECNGVCFPVDQRARKDVVELGPNTEVKIFMRFRDWLGRYVTHCHNVVHEDDAMMLRWDIDTVGDNLTTP